MTTYLTYVHNRCANSTHVWRNHLQAAIDHGEGALGLGSYGAGTGTQERPG